MAYENKKYLAYVRAHQCMMIGSPNCSGSVVAHHYERGGIATKCSDIGTNADNVRDMVEDERHGAGTRNVNSKLSDDEVVNILGTYAGGNCTQLELAREYGVSRSAVGLIVTRKNWKHIQCNLEVIR